MTIGEFINRRRMELGLTLEDIGNATGVKKSTVKKWETGSISNMGRDKIDALAKILKVSPIVFINEDIDDYYNVIHTTNVSRTLPPNIIPLSSVTYIPLVGTIACGTPIFAEQNIERKILLPDMVKADFAVRCKGSSMINAGINDGDIAFIRSQKMVENGEIAAVQIMNFETEATLKKVYITDTSITLVAQNPEYEPITFTGEDMNRVEIIGKCVAVLKDFEE